MSRTDKTLRAGWRAVEAPAAACGFGAGLTPAPESPGVAREREEIFPAAGNRGGGAALRRVAVSSLPELMSTWDYLLSDCARIYSGSVLPVKKQGGLNPGLVMY